ncbi:hypothetical protein D9V29_10550 [Mycetocola manganoxydans]|uniref:Uncharacterized protein n=2 Tax=Mycetocola manganoxydans TaxID=699879 RepID=A0A3L6ZQX2_9MICO|nr:hypothetical protein D9V29_10550 [Mycetocola manganoxydans]
MDRMTNISAETAANVPLTSNDLIEQRVSDLIGRACRRQLWLLFLDHENIQLPLIMPMADYPESPGGGNARQLAAAIREIVDAAGAAQVIVVWERYASESLTEVDAAWARHLHHACTTEGISVRAQLLSHKRGVRWLAADDYLV